LAAFRRVFDAHAAGLRRYANRFVRSSDVAEDLVQDVFWRVWQRWHELDAQGNIRAYLYAATRARALDYLESVEADARRRERYEPPAHTADAGTATDDDPALTTERLTDAIRQVLDAMPPRQRAVAALRLRDGLSTAAIAARLGISPRTVEVHIARATRALRDQLPRLLEP
jgi:RNA polymerase sigma-70 factor (family 1)